MRVPRRRRAGSELRPWRISGRRALAGLLCLSLLVWSILPQVSHVPGITGTLAEHAQMIADHGHSHGLEEDLYWALHGHSHDADHHDHSHALATAGASSDTFIAGRDAWPRRPSLANPFHKTPIDRPPRA